MAKMLDIGTCNGSFPTEYDVICGDVIAQLPSWDAKYHLRLPHESYTLKSVKVGLEEKKANSSQLSASLNKYKQPSMDIWPLQL